MSRKLTTAFALTFAIPAAALAQSPGRGPTQDAFYWLSEVNKASAVMVVETGIVDPALGSTISKSISSAIAEGDAKPTIRSGDYLRYEPLLIAAGGPEVTRLHSGRSRQDIGATTRRLTQREQLLNTMDSLSKARLALIEFAAKDPNAVVPAYTWGVQAQPISFGHWMLAYSEALQRAGAQMKQAYAAINMSPLGSAALGTSSFPVDRRRLAQLLGFDGVIENSLDANQISPIDTGAQIVGAAAATSLVTGTFAADIEAQYRMSTPWVIFAEGETSGSSIMPQKRNPVSLQSLRILSSQVMGDVSTFYFKAHNIPAGQGDYKGTDSEEALRNTSAMLEQLAEMTTELIFDPKRAAEEVAGDYSATTELADTLQREGNVPFRVGHHFASELVTFGRTRSLKPAQIKYVDAQRIFTDAAKHFELPSTRLPLDEKRFQLVMTGENMVAASKALGGPQPAEVARMMAEQRAAVATDRAWTGDRRRALADAAAARNAAFLALQK